MKRRSEAIILFAFWLLWWILFVFLRLPKSYLGYLTLLIFGLLIFIASVWRALRAFVVDNPQGSVLWLLLLVPLAILSFSSWARSAMNEADFRVFSDPSSAMAPTIQMNDRFVADMRGYHGDGMKSGSVVLIQRPDHVILIKRIIAVGGDTIQSRGNEIFLNDQKLIEPYVQHNGNAPDYLRNFGPIQVPQHKLFVMGDNRDLSLDSRSPEFGLIDESFIIGKPLYLIAGSRNKPSRLIR